MTTRPLRTVAEETPVGLSYSVIIPVYNEAGNLTPLYHALMEAMGSPSRRLRNHLY